MHAVWRYPAYGYKTDCCGWSTCNAPWAAPKPMDVIQSQIRTDDSQFRANREAMQRLVAELNDRLTVARQGGGAKPQVRHREQGKLPVRERIDRLIDPVSPFLEFFPPLTAGHTYDGDAPAAGLVTGLSRVAGREVVIVTNDATVEGETWRQSTQVDRNHRSRSCRAAGPGSGAAGVHGGRAESALGG